MKFCDILNDDDFENLLNEWFEFRENKFAYMDDEDIEHLVDFDSYSEKILNHVNDKSYDYVSKKLDFLLDDCIAYCDYWNRKFYFLGFSDAVKLIAGSMKK